MAITRADSKKANRIAHDLEEAYQVVVPRDWGEQEIGDWRGGNWSVQDLHNLRKAIRNLAGTMGGADSFVGNVGRVVVERAKMRFRGLAFKRRIKFSATSKIDGWTVVHELSHIWDARSGGRLSKALQLYTGGCTSRLRKLVKDVRRQCDEQRRRPGCNRFGYFYAGVPPAGSDQNFNRKEDFAESVAAYVYPSEAQSRVERFKDDDDYGELYYSDYTQTKRWAFVDGLMRAR